MFICHWALTCLVMMMTTSSGIDTIGQYCLTHYPDSYKNFTDTDEKPCNSYIREFFHPNETTPTYSPFLEQYLSYRATAVATTIPIVHSATKIIIVQVVDRKTHGTMAKIHKISNHVLSLYSSIHDIDFVSFRGHVGKKAWSAAFSRIYVMKWLLESDYKWVFYLDADALIVNKKFNVKKLVRKFSNKAFLFCRGGLLGESGQDWDVNNGVFFANLKHPLVRNMIESILEYLKMYESMFEDIGNDDWETKNPVGVNFLIIQAAMHRFFQYDADVFGNVPYLKVFRGAEHNLFNYHGPNVVHAVRAGFKTPQERLEFTMAKSQNFLLSLSV